MKYVSTRGNAPKARFCEILLGGLAPDGGLYLPEEYPQITAETLTMWRKFSYPELAYTIFSLFIDDIPTDELRRLCYKTYTAETFSHSRTHNEAKDITPLVTLESGFHILELSNGPTLAFKDIALQMLGNLFEYVLEKQNKKINILGATSGDTGSAAEYALRGKENINLFMLSPEGRMSPFQQAQMYSLTDSNIFNIAIQGTFDDAQAIVVAVSNDSEFKAKYHIGAVNSINWARVMAQIVYYFKGWLVATSHANELVDFAIPTGNFGNICAGHIARMMGLPIRHLVLATNENDVLDVFFRSGVYKPRHTEEVHKTSSCSMDISKAQNFERFVYNLVERDSAVVRQLWDDLHTKGYFAMQDCDWWKLRACFGIVSGMSTNADRLKTIRSIWEQYSVTIDPHTADGIKVALEYREIGVPMVVLETAQPAKFSQTMYEALGWNPVVLKEFRNLERMSERVTVMQPDVELVKKFIAQNV
jgi:threonine synthase